MLCVTVSSKTLQRKFVSADITHEFSLIEPHLKRGFMRRVFCFISFIFVLTTTAHAAATKVKVSGKVSNGAGYTVLLVQKSGALKSATVSDAGTFSFSKVSLTSLKNASFQLVAPDGGFFGPVVLAGKSATGYLNFSGKLPEGVSGLKVGTIELKSGFGKLSRALNRAAYSRAKSVAVDSDGKPSGAGKLGLFDVGISELGALDVDEEATEAGQDQDGDGVINAFDVDDDGDLVLDAQDPESAGTSARNNPWATLFLRIGQSINVNIGNLSRATIDDTLGTQQLLTLIFYLRTEGTAYESASGGHVICSDSNEYCRQTSAGGGTAIYGGFFNSDPSITGNPWTDFNANGSGYPNLEPYEDGLLIASVGPAIETSKLRAGDLFNVQFTNGSTVLSSLTMSLSPYFISGPAIKSYNAGSGEVNINYSQTPITGDSSGDPILLSSAGVLTVNFWRPQRDAIPGAEEGEFMDMGRLHYGVVVSSGQSEFGCAGHFSALSQSLSESAGEGEEDPNLWPLTDSTDDAAPSASNLLSFTVNLKNCIAAKSVSAGTYNVALTAAGEYLTGGANRATQEVRVAIP